MLKKVKHVKINCKKKIEQKGKTKKKIGKKRKLKIRYNTEINH
jgi:hypothetical protein